MVAFPSIQRFTSVSLSLSFIITFTICPFSFMKVVDKRKSRLLEVAILCAFCFTYVFIEQNFNSWLPSFYRQHLNVNSFFALQASAFLALFSYVGRIVTANIIQRFQLDRYFIFCVLMILMMLVFSQILVTNNLSLSLFIFPLIGLFLAPLYPVISSKMIANVNKSDINVFTSLIVIFSSLGSSFGSVMMSYVFQWKYGTYYSLFISVAVTILLILSFLYFQSYVSKKENNL